MDRRLLFVMRRAPYRGILAQEALDALLAAAAFGLDPGALFMDEGVMQLVDSQSPGTLSRKNLAANLKALPLYEVERLYVHRPSLERRGLTQADLILPGLRPVDDPEVGELFAQHDQLLSF